MQENKPVLVVGLGNPGPEYVRTRHNVGFKAVARIVGAAGTWKKDHNALVATMDIDGRRVIFAMPQTYMNLSGDSVGPIMRYYKIPLENLIVIHDDMDLPIGTSREKIGGGSAGHNGIRSIDKAVGNEYRRIRIGIGHPRELGLPMSPADWVLGKFSDEDLEKLRTVIDNIQLF
ncbi:aminoacyl-tRNA hydrolase [bacterium]|nr:aminoacyl-tRNA hydrolase [bacterium]